MDFKHIYPVRNYCLIKLDKETVVDTNDIIKPNLIQYETDGGKVASKVDPRLYEHCGTLLRCNYKDIEDIVYTMLEPISPNEHKNYDIKVRLRDKAVIENFKDNNILYEDVVIVNVSDIRYLYLEDNTNNTNSKEK